MMKLYWKSMDIFYINWKLYWIITVVLLYQIGFSTSLRKGRLMIPPTYSALSHDLHIQLQIEQYSLNESQNLNLKITRIDNYNEYNLKFNVIGFIEIYLNQNSNVTQITIPCNYFIRGGLYELEIVDKNSISNNLSNYLVGQDERLKQQLDVRWPIPKLSVTPESIGTYPQQSLTAILEFPENECILPNLNNINSNSLSNDEDHINLQSDLDLPEFWLELLYCGRDIYCSSDNITKSQLLYKEQVRGFPKTRIIKLSCELFGLAGHYIFKLKPDSTIPSSVSSSAYIKADWSEQFVFNVHARSIFPCDHSGIGVLFEYPSCILDQADRIRLFAKQRADVASLAPPTSLHYITEQRVKRGQHSLYFNCDLFSEKYVEYCFVYVSQAITNAVADVRMDCVPTLPVSESDTGGWGPWSEWTPCSTTCAGGTRNRYRFCDSPPPRYGAKFCEIAGCQIIIKIKPLFERRGIKFNKFPLKLVASIIKRQNEIMSPFDIEVSSTIAQEISDLNYSSTTDFSTILENDSFIQTTLDTDSAHLVNNSLDETTTDGIVDTTFSSTLEEVTTYPVEITTNIGAISSITRNPFLRSLHIPSEQTTPVDSNVNHVSDQINIPNPFLRSLHIPSEQTTPVDSNVNHESDQLNIPNTYLRSLHIPSEQTTPVDSNVNHVSDQLNIPNPFLRSLHIPSEQTTMKTVLTSTTEVIPLNPNFRREPRKLPINRNDSEAVTKSASQKTTKRMKTTTTRRSPQNQKHSKSEKNVKTKTASNAKQQMKSTTTFKTSAKPNFNSKTTFKTSTKPKYLNQNQ